MRARCAPHLLAAAAAAALSACGARGDRGARPPAARPPPPRCEALAVAARSARRGADPLELVIAVNGATCHREPLLAAAGRIVTARVNDVCRHHFAPGRNRVDVRLARRRSCGRPVARTSLRCTAPEPD
ncbi:MAG TPA: hypothetical protein VKZ63_19140 [Kofleriaceae bacterium]|nr:hypothetical protein [Kofleriaceae bacterium]